MVSWPGKVIKIWLKHSSTVLTKKIRTASKPVWGMFRVQDRCNYAQLSTFPTLVFFMPGKVVKIRPKQFSNVLKENDKNSTPNIMGMFRVQNGVIRAQFWTSPVSSLFWSCTDPKKSSTFDWNFFQPYSRETIRTAPQNIVGMFWVKNRLICVRFSTFPTLLLSAHRKEVKIWTKYFSIVLTRNDKNWTPNIVVCFGRKTE